MLTPHVVSLSGGKDSTAMLLRMLELGEPVHSAVFFDTGWEFPQMYDHLNRLEREIAPVPLVRLKPRFPFEHFLLRHGTRNGGTVKGRGWPSIVRRWCTTEKRQDIARYIRTVQDAVECIGYAVDELHRTQRRGMQAPSRNLRFPLVEWEWDEASALSYCLDRGYDWSGLYKFFVRVSCFCCPLQRIGELKTIRRHFPRQWLIMLQWEDVMEPPHLYGEKGCSLHDLDARFAEEDRQLSFLDSIC